MSFITNAPRRKVNKSIAADSEAIAQQQLIGLWSQNAPALGETNESK